MSAISKKRGISKETRAKMANSLKGRIVTPETRAKIAKANTGKHPTAETRAKMSISRRARPKLSEETKHKISLSMIGKIGTPQMRLKLSQRNKKDSINISRRVKEYWASHPEERERVSERFKRLNADPIYKARVSADSKKFWKTDADKKMSKLMNAQHRRPNIPEKIVMDILSAEFPNEWKYVGNGDVIINKLNPDFININGKKLIIEVFGNYWHGERARDYKSTEKGRKEIFSDYGYKTLILWEKDIKRMSSVELTAKIIEFSK